MGPLSGCSAYFRYMLYFQWDFPGGFSRLFSTWDSKGAKVWQSCRSRKKLQNEYLLAKIGVDTAANEPSKLDHLAEKSV